MVFLSPVVARPTKKKPSAKPKIQEKRQSKAAAAAHAPTDQSDFNHVYHLFFPIMAASKDVSLPMARVRTIMKSSPEVDAVSQESLFVITKATELFVMYLTKLAQRNGDNEEEVKYSDLAAVVQRKDSMEFLHDIVPPKIKYQEYLDQMAKDSKEDEMDLL